MGVQIGGKPADGQHTVYGFEFLAKHASNSVTIIQNPAHLFMYATRFLGPGDIHSSLESSVTESKTPGKCHLAQPPARFLSLMGMTTHR